MPAHTYLVILRFTSNSLNCDITALFQQLFLLALWFTQVQVILGRHTQRSCWLSIADLSNNVKPNPGIFYPICGQAEQFLWSAQDYGDMTNGVACVTVWLWWLGEKDGVGAGINLLPRNTGVPCSAAYNALQIQQSTGIIHLSGTSQADH